MDREATVVRVEGVVLLKVEDEVGQADEDAKDSVNHLDRKSRVLSPLFWHIPVDVRLGGGGCREDFRPQAETRGKQAKWRGAAKAHKGDRKARVGRGPKL